MVRSPTGHVERAYPARRIVEAASRFGLENTALFSVCRTSYEPVADFLVERYAAQAGR